MDKETFERGATLLANEFDQEQATDALEVATAYLAGEDTGMAHYVWGTPIRNMLRQWGISRDDAELDDTWALYMKRAAEIRLDPAFVPLEKPTVRDLSQDDWGGKETHSVWVKPMGMLSGDEVYRVLHFFTDGTYLEKQMIGAKDELKSNSNLECGFFAIENNAFQIVPGWHEGTILAADGEPFPYEISADGSQISYNDWVYHRVE
ncbi:MAG: hypothetical protein KF784_02155 [Fimbriimonadaceae bacterium]|nr:hypothetical protein [Fimbriimonadaceae bacterium]